MRLMAVKKCARIVALVQEAEPEKACTRRGERLYNSKSVAAARSTRTAASPLQRAAERDAAVSPEGVTRRDYLEREIETATQHSEVVPRSVDYSER